MNGALEYSHLPAEKEGKIRPLQGEGLARANNNSKAWKCAQCSGHRAIRLGLEHRGAAGRGWGSGCPAGKGLYSGGSWSPGDFQTGMFFKAVSVHSLKIGEGRDTRDRESKTGTRYGCLSWTGQVEKTELGTHLQDLRVAFLLDNLHL